MEKFSKYLSLPPPSSPFMANLNHTPLCGEGGPVRSVVEVGHGGREGRGEGRRRESEEWGVYFIIKCGSIIIALELEWMDKIDF